MQHVKKGVLSIFMICDKAIRSAAAAAAAAAENLFCVEAVKKLEPDGRQLGVLPVLPVSAVAYATCRR